MKNGCLFSDWSLHRMRVRNKKAVDNSEQIDMSDSNVIDDMNQIIEQMKRAMKKLAEQIPDGQLCRRFMKLDGCEECRGTGFKDCIQARIDAAMNAAEKGK